MIIIQLSLKFIPVRGRKRIQCNHAPQHDALKFIPVRGRKLYCNHATCCHVGLPLKFIPVRGRKHCQRSAILLIRNVEIYPREGTETPVRADIREHLVTENVEIYPREGTETDRRNRASISTVSSLKFIPVRGRKHRVIRRVYMFCLR